MNTDTNDSAGEVQKPALELVPVTRDQFLATKKDAGKIHEVKAFGGLVYFKEFTPETRDQFEANLVVGKGKAARVNTANIRAKMFVTCVCDPKGNRIFSDADYKEVAKLPGPEVEKVYQKMQEVNSFSDEDIEELAGNSDADRSEAGQ